MVRASIVGGAAVVALGATAVVTARLLKRSAAHDEYVDINTADHERLLTISHIGPERATQIIKMRKAQPFSSVSDLEGRVGGIGPAILARIMAQGRACVGSQPKSGQA